MVNAVESATLSDVVDKAAQARTDAPLSSAVDPAVMEPAVIVRAWFPKNDGTLIFPEIDDPSFSLPALNSKSDLAVCLSGGGLRASTLALGWLRALNEMKVLDKVKYLNTISGGSWTGSALCFQEKPDVDTFLGPYLKPNECKLPALRKGDDGSYAGAAIAARLKDTFLKYVQEDLEQAVQHTSFAEAKAGAWTRAISDCFLAPFGPSKTQHSTVGVLGQEHLHKPLGSANGLPHPRLGEVYKTSIDKLPYLVIGQVVMARGPDGTNEYVCHEWTPIYAGCPKAATKTQPRLGAGWIGSQGINASLVGEKPAVSPGGSADIAVQPRGPASLGEASGISSAYASLMVANALGNFPSQVDHQVRRVLTSSDGVAEGEPAPAPAARMAPNGHANDDANGIVFDDEDDESGALPGMGRSAAGRPTLPMGIKQAMGSVLSQMPPGVLEDLAQLWHHPGKLRPLVLDTLGFNSSHVPNLEDWTTTQVHLSDGGGTDLFGIYPALRRKVSNIMVLVANSSSLDNEEDFSHNLAQLPGLFGLCKVKGADEVKAQKYISNLQVFAPEGWPRLYQDLVQKKREGKAAVVVGTYKVLDNPIRGVYGKRADGSDYYVRVLWCINDVHANWEKELPMDTLAQLIVRRGINAATTLALEAVKGSLPEQYRHLPSMLRDYMHMFVLEDLDDFPLVNTMALQYKPELVGLLSNHAAAMLMTNEALVKQMLTEVGVPAAEAQ